MTDILNAVGFSRPTFFRVLKQYHETGHVSKPKSLCCGRLRALSYGDVHVAPPRACQTMTRLVPGRATAPSGDQPFYICPLHHDSHHSRASWNLTQETSSRGTRAQRGPLH